MMVKVQFGENVATVTNQRWSSAHKRLADILNDSLFEYSTSPSDPNPDMTAAEKAIEMFGGKVLSFTPVEYVEGRIY